MKYRAQGPVKHTHCKYCGARLRRDPVGQFCPTQKCQWHHGLPMGEDSPTRPILFGLDKKQNRFAPASAYELRKELDKYLEDIQDFADCARGCLQRRQFEAGGLPYCLNQLVARARKVKNFYEATR